MMPACRGRWLFGEGKEHRHDCVLMDDHTGPCVCECGATCDWNLVFGPRRDD